jgi:hypothetical protein
MNQNFKPNERELIKVATFFKKYSRKLMDDGKLSEEYKSVGESVDRFIGEMEIHANTRAAILANRQQLGKLIKDNPVCPRCHSSDKLKLSGTEKNSKGWTSNKYRCRKCNITFTWNRPNNPWDMVGFLSEFLDVMRLKRNTPDISDTEKADSDRMIETMQGNLNALKETIAEHDTEYHAILERDNEMEKLIHEFKNTLLIEKIKMDTWENTKKP